MLFYIVIVISFGGTPGRNWEGVKGRHLRSWEQPVSWSGCWLFGCVHFIQTHWAAYLGCVHLLHVCMLLINKKFFRKEEFFGSWDWRKTQTECLSDLQKEIYKDSLVSVFISLPKTSPPPKLYIICHCNNDKAWQTKKSSLEGLRKQISYTSIKALKDVRFLFFHSIWDIIDM